MLVDQMKCVVAFSLFGSDEEDVYYKGAVAQANLYRRNFPLWDLWYYVGRSVPDSVLESIFMVNGNAKFEFVEEPEDQTATWWRFRAIRYAEADAVFTRDVDSRLCNREISAIEDFLSQTEYPYHMMRDHELHGVQLMAGMFGVQQSAFYELQSLPERTIEAGFGDFYQTDQRVMLYRIWPHAKRKIMAHIGCQWLYEKAAQRRPFRVARMKGTFVGQGITGDGRPRVPEHLEERYLLTDEYLLKRSDVFEDRFRRKWGIRDAIPPPLPSQILNR